MPLHHIIYLSTPVSPLAPAQLAELLAECRTGNQRRDITGVLLYGPRHFLQLIEGEAAAVLALYERLQHDPRHYNLIKVADKPIEGRAFGEWSMAFRWLDSVAPSEGYHPLEAVPVAPPALAAADAQLLETVRQQLLTE